MHLVFPRIFPVLPPGGSGHCTCRKSWMRSAATGRTGLWAAALFAVAMLPFARPVFDVSLQAMNTVGAETCAAEKLLTDVWGGMFDKVYVLTEGPSIEELQAQGDSPRGQNRGGPAGGGALSGFRAVHDRPGRGAAAQELRRVEGVLETRTGSKP